MTVVCLTTLVLSGMLWGQVPNSVDPAQLLKQVDAKVSFMDTDFSAEYTIVKDSPGEGRSVTVAAMFRRDRDNKYLILILQPAVDKGKGYLKIDNNLWLWDPVARRYTVTSARDRFQNSNARNSDFTRSSLAIDYEATTSSRQQLGKFDCTLLELKGKTDSVVFPFRKIWVSQDNLVRKMEDYSLSRQLLRTTAIPSYQQVGTRWVPLSMVIVDELRGKKLNGVFKKEQTQVSIAKPNLEKMPDLLFTQAYLEKVR
jgi:outer membrane lipoprotein-sorting protein